MVSSNCLGALQFYCRYATLMRTGSIDLSQKTLQDNSLKKTCLIQLSKKAYLIKLPLTKKRRGGEGEF